MHCTYKWSKNYTPIKIQHKRSDPKQQNWTDFFSPTSRGSKRTALGTHTTLRLPIKYYTHCTRVYTPLHICRQRTQLFPYPVYKVDPSEGSNLPRIVDKSYIPLGGGIKLFDLNVPEAVQKLPPYLPSDSISNGQSYFVVLVIFFLYFKHRRHENPEGFQQHFIYGCKVKKVVRILCISTKELYKRNGILLLLQLLEVVVISIED